MKKEEYKTNKGSSLEKPTLANLLSGSDETCAEITPQEPKSTFIDEGFSFGHKDDLDLIDNDVGRKKSSKHFIFRFL